MAAIRRITASFELDPPIEDIEEAFQSFFECLNDEMCDVTYEYTDGVVTHTSPQS